MLVLKIAGGTLRPLDHVPKERNVFRMDSTTDSFMVPTYNKVQITPLKDNYNGATPDPSYIPGWHLTLDGLASGVSVALDISAIS